MKRKYTPYLFTMPYFILYILFGLFPILFALYISFTNWKGIGARDFIGFENYVRVFGPSSYFLQSIWNNIVIMLEYIPAVMILGLLIANLLYSKHVKLKNVFRLLSFLPYIVTPVAVALIFAILFDWKIGVVNQILVKTCLVEDGIFWLGKPNYARIVLGILMIWKFIGYHIMMYLAGISNIPSELRESALIDGANGKDVLFRIVIPLLRPVILFLAITDIIYGFQLVEEPMLLFTGWQRGLTYVGGPGRACLTSVWNLYDTAFGVNMDYGMGCAIAYTLFLFILGFSLIGFRVYSRKGEDI